MLLNLFLVKIGSYLLLKQNTKSYNDIKGFAKFIKMCEKRKIPLILETPGDCADYSKQISLVKGWVNNFI
jgi:endonuclease IV